MKKVVALLTIFCLVVVCHSPVFSSTKALDSCDYIANEDDDDECGPLGYGASKASVTTTGMSMLAWGLGLAAAIAILAGLISQSTGSTAHSDSN